MFVSPPPLSAAAVASPGVFAYVLPPPSWTIDDGALRPTRCWTPCCRPPAPPCPCRRRRPLPLPLRACLPTCFRRPPVPSSLGPPFRRPPVPSLGRPLRPPRPRGFVSFLVSRQRVRDPLSRQRAPSFSPTSPLPGASPSIEDPCTRFLVLDRRLQNWRGQIVPHVCTVCTQACAYSSDKYIH